MLWRNITDTGFPETPASRIASLSEPAENWTFRSLEFLMSRHRVHRSGESVSGLQIRQRLQREATCSHGDCSCWTSEKAVRSSLHITKATKGPVPMISRVVAKRGRIAKDASTNPAKEAQRHRPESALNGQALPTPAKGIVLLTHPQCGKCEEEREGKHVRYSDHKKAWRRGRRVILCHI